MGKRHTRAPFDLGLMTEEGFGTADQLNAYIFYIRGCLERDERAIARMRELRAAASENLRAAVRVFYQNGSLHNDSVRGNETLVDLLNWFLAGEPQGGN